MEALLTFDNLVALVTLTALEIVLGVDNIVFISILAGKLPHEQQARARTTGLGLALGTRILLLLSISWVAQLTTPLFHVLGQEISGRDLILATGGLFLIAKATYEIHERLEGEEGHGVTGAAPSFASVIIQILVLDMVFSLDSIITAVGLANEVPIMIAAVVIAIGIMLVSAGAISNFVNHHPTVKMLALAFLLLIGVSLVTEAFEVHIPKGYIYFAMAFSVLVESLNLFAHRRRVPPPVELRPTYIKDGTASGAVARPALTEETPHPAPPQATG